jgi:quercetin dioxygenase-like cupin family protein
MSKAHRPSVAPGRWQAVEVQHYKAEGSAPFRDITRQALFDHPDLGCQLRYFEIAPGGYSTLERHEHLHAVLILRGQGRCLVDGKVFNVGSNDLLQVPALGWHQFRADETQPLGFLCMVNRERDRPQLPTEEDLTQLRRDPVVAAFIKC